MSSEQSQQDVEAKANTVAPKNESGDRSAGHDYEDVLQLIGSARILSEQEFLSKSKYIYF